MARPTLDRNVKFKRLCRELELPKPYVRGLLETMWDCAHECGNPILGDDADIESAAEWPGEVGAFAGLVVLVGFVDARPDGMYEIHDYWDHAPDYVRKRRQREIERETIGAELEQTADNGGQRRTTAPNISTPAPAPAPTLIEECSNEHSCESPEPVDWFFDLWNEHCKHAQLKKRNTARRALVRLRIKELGEEEVRKIPVVVAASPFLRGESDSGWRATFDWAMKKNNALKIVEGAYGERGERRGSGRVRSGEKYDHLFNQ